MDRTISTRTSAAPATFPVTIQTESLPDYHCLWCSLWAGPLAPLLLRACLRSFVTKAPANLLYRQVLSVSRGHRHRETLAVVELRQGVTTERRPSRRWLPRR